MKNLLFYNGWKIFPTGGGVERVVSLQHRELSRRGYRIFTVYLNPAEGADAIPDQFPLPVPGSADAPENMAYLRDFLKRHGIGLALNFIAILNRTSLCLVEACRTEGVPLLSVLHNTLAYPLLGRPFLRPLMERRAGRAVLTGLLNIAHRLPFLKLQRYQYRHSAATVVLASCYVDEYQRMVCRKARNVFPVHNPLPISVCRTDWQEKEQVALFVGRLARQKSVDKLIRAWARAAIPSWKLFVVGSGPEEARLKRLATKLGVADSISFEGHRPPQSYYRRAKLFCLTSIYEGYPMTLIECQAHGVVPVIYDSFPAAKEMVANGYNGLLVPAFNEAQYAEGLRRLAVDDSLLQQMSGHGYEEVGKYAVDPIMEQWVQLIEQFGKTFND